MLETKEIKDDSLEKINSGINQELPEDKWFNLSWFQFNGGKCELITDGARTCEFCDHCVVKHGLNVDYYYCKMGKDPKTKKGPVIID